MVRARDAIPHTEVLIRPRRSLLRTGLVAVIVAGVPLFAVLYWLAVSQGSWQRVLIVEVILLACCAVLWWRFRVSFVRVDGTLLTKQAFAHRTVVERADVATILLAETYRGTSSDTIPQLLALDAAGARLLRLRGTFWAREDMVRIAEAIGAPITTELVPMTSREYYLLHPGVAYWYEGRPWLAVVGILIAGAIAAATISWLMSAAGVPFVFGTAT